MINSHLYIIFGNKLKQIKSVSKEQFTNYRNTIMELNY
jgi:hypothetical protein